MAKINLGKVVGDDGRGIVSIIKTATQGLVDTYTITYTDGTTSTFEVTNGSGGGGGTANYNELVNKPQINGIELTGNKSSSDLGIMTNTVSNLVNYYLKSETYTKQEVRDLISAIETMHYEVVEELPTVGESNIIYLTPKEESEENDFYDEYIYTNNTWEKIGGTQIDLSNYVTNQQLTQALNGKQDTLVSGTNIKTINNLSILGSGNIDIQGGDSLLTVETITKGEGDIPVTGLTLDYTKLTLQTNQETRIACSVLPSNATDTRITWLSSDTSIATVEDGLVTGVAGGNATVTAKSVSNPSVTADCSVTVIGDTPTPGQKVYLYDLTPTGAGKILKKDGHTEFSTGGGNYWEIPYSDGLYIVTGLNKGWVNNYPPFIVKVGETVTIPEFNRYEGTPYYDTASKYDTTLTGFSSEAKVYVNTFQLYATNRDKVYYELGGNE